MDNIDIYTRKLCIYIPSIFYLAGPLFGSKKSLQAFTVAFVSPVQRPGKAFPIGTLFI
ncbi:hypothetical protein GCM10008986_11440 [Salinibacillus aidingensis]|uniref:Uncharacterized protein n=1 Tax=Salinibacillus aidingensis TaxID=237684 RepID=A0ABN1B088_9BACI